VKVANQGEEDEMAIPVHRLQPQDLEDMSVPQHKPARLSLVRRMAQVLEWKRDHYTAERRARLRAMAQRPAVRHG
jgi:hypothetical protein